MLLLRQSGNHADGLGRLVLRRLRGMAAGGAAQMSVALDDFLFVALKQDRVPYIWGGKELDVGLDCSGLITSTMHHLGGLDWRFTHACADLWCDLPKLDAPRPGALCFFGAPNGGGPSHVMIWIAPGIVYGASGGNHTTITPTAGACVQFRQIKLYRKDFQGYRALPLVG